MNGTLQIGIFALDRLLAVFKNCDTKSGFPSANSHLSKDFNNQTDTRIDLWETQALAAHNNMKPLWIVSNPSDFARSIETATDALKVLLSSWDREIIL